MPGRFNINAIKILYVEKRYLNIEIFSALKIDIWKPERDKSEKINDWIIDNIKYKNSLDISINSIFSLLILVNTRLKNLEKLLWVNSFRPGGAGGE